MAEQQITGLPTQAAPIERRTKDSERLALLAVRASFNGAGAATAFVPTVEIVSDSGKVVGTFPADDSVAAGGSADATFAPFLRNRRGDIRFGVLNVGDFLSIETTGNGAHLGSGIYLKTSGDMRWDIGRDWNIDTIGRDVNIGPVTRDWNIETGNDTNWAADQDFNLSTGRDFNVSTGRDFNVSGTTASFNPTNLSFFGVPPASQQATPVTLGDVIALLQAYGLSA